MALFTQTHSIDYEPENLGRDWVTARCGEGVHITSYSSDPQCKQCRVILLRERPHRAQKIALVRGLMDRALDEMLEP